MGFTLISEGMYAFKSIHIERKLAPDKEYNTIIEKAYWRKGKDYSFPKFSCIKDIKRMS